MRGNSKDLMEGEQTARSDSLAVPAFHTSLFFLFFIPHRYSKSLNVILQHLFFNPFHPVLIALFPAKFNYFRRDPGVFIAVPRAERRSFSGGAGEGRGSLEQGWLKCRVHNYNIRVVFFKVIMKHFLHGYFINWVKNIVVCNSKASDDHGYIFFCTLAIVSLLKRRINVITCPRPLNSKV